MSAGVVLRAGCGLLLLDRQCTNCCFIAIELIKIMIYYFARPCASWQYGLNGNANGLIRQYVPKGCDFDAESDAYLARIMARLNHCPCKCLAMKMPHEVFFCEICCCISEFNPPERLLVRKNAQKE